MSVGKYKHHSNQGFQKGNKLGLGKKYSLGMKRSLLTKNKMSNAMVGRNITWGKKISKAKKGVKFTDEHKRKLSLAKIGRKMPWVSERMKKNTGEKNNLWKGGITPINAKIRTSLEYKLWRTAVFERDNYICIWGGKEHGNKLVADHIKPFADYPELRFAIDNGRTLCENCHKTTNTYGKH